MTGRDKKLIRNRRIERLIFTGQTGESRSADETPTSERHA